MTQLTIDQNQLYAAVLQTLAGNAPIDIRNLKYDMGLRILDTRLIESGGLQQLIVNALASYIENTSEYEDFFH